MYLQQGKRDVKNISSFDPVVKRRAGQQHMMLVVDSAGNDVIKQVAKKEDPPPKENKRAEIPYQVTPNDTADLSFLD